jgi:septal ring factor EnvC (AmiA/AmiB activator)
MMDHALIMAELTLISTTQSLTSMKLVLPQIENWQQSIKQLMINIRTKDSHEIEAARHQLKDSQNEITALEEQLMSDNATNELFLFRLLESIRRICAYARDFGEVLLNIKLHDESYTSTQ